MLASIFYEHKIGTCTFVCAVKKNEYHKHIIKFNVLSVMINSAVEFVPCQVAITVEPYQFDCFGKKIKADSIK